MVSQTCWSSCYSPFRCHTQSIWKWWYTGYTMVFAAMKQIQLGFHLFHHRWEFNVRRHENSEMLSHHSGRSTRYLFVLCQRCRKTKTVCLIYFICLFVFHHKWQQKSDTRLIYLLELLPPHQQGETDKTCTWKKQFSHSQTNIKEIFQKNKIQKLTASLFWS